MTNNFKYSKDRKFSSNLIYCILCFLGLLIFASIFKIILSSFIKNDSISSILANIIMIVIMYLFYYKDLNSEAKLYKNNFKECFSKSFKYYILGYMAMIFFNLLLSIFLKSIPSNEEQVRQMLFNNTLISMISISIIAPISEEIIFRKSLQPLIKNKWFYVLLSGFLFGFAHILTNIVSGEFIISDLLYILPYGSLGLSFALMDNETKTTFSSIVIHAIHNTVTSLLLLALYKGGFI